MVAVPSMQAQTTAVQSGLLASRIVAAGLRAASTDMNALDADALTTLVELLGSEARSAAGAARDYERYAFAYATHEASPAPAPDFTQDLDQVTQDAALLLKAANATGKTRAKLLADEANREAAKRLVDRFEAVSQLALAQAGSPGDSLGGGA
jgi:hypothetical protein